MMKIENLGSKESEGVKSEDVICAELCLRLWFESDLYFCNVTESGWFWKHLARNKFPKNFFLKSVFFKLHQICTSQNHKNHFFSINVIFLGYSTQFSQKGKSIAPKTLNYFQEHRKKEYSKIKRFSFGLIIGSNLRFKF